MKELIEEVCQEQQIEIFKLEVGTYRVYLHADMPPMEAANCLVRKMKRRTSNMMCKEFPQLRSRLPSLWTLHYFLSTEPEMPEEEIAKWEQTQPRFMPKKKK